MGSYPRLLSQAVAKIFPQELPDMDKFCACWRGGGFRDQFKGFYEQMQGELYRVPGFLATSLNESVAMRFVCRANTAHPRVLWCILVRAPGVRTSETCLIHSWTSSYTIVVYLVA